MAATHFLQLISGRIQRVFGVVVSAGAADDGKIPVFDATGKLDISVLPTGLGVNTQAATASEALTANDIVDIYNNAGVVTMRKADATTNGKLGDAFVKANVSNGAVGTAYMPGNMITGLSGLTPGAPQYLSTTPGGRTETPPSTVGNVVQQVGIAMSATSMLFDPLTDITL